METLPFILLGVASFVLPMLFGYLKSKSYYVRTDDLLKEDRPVKVKLKLFHAACDDDPCLYAEILPLTPGYTEQTMMMRLPAWDAETFIEREIEAFGFFGPLNGKCYAIRLNRHKFNFNNCRREICLT